jgi:hypothetical protein
MPERGAPRARAARRTPRAARRAAPPHVQRARRAAEALRDGFQHGARVAGRDEQDV